MPHSDITTDTEHSASEPRNDGQKAGPGKRPRHSKKRNGVALGTAVAVLMTGATYLSVQPAAAAETRVQVGKLHLVLEKNQYAHIGYRGPNGETTNITVDFPGMKVNPNAQVSIFEIQSKLNRSVDQIQTLTGWNVRRQADREQIGREITKLEDSLSDLKSRGVNLSRTRNALDKLHGVTSELQQVNQCRGRCLGAGANFARNISLMALGAVLTGVVSSGALAALPAAAVGAAIAIFVGTVAAGFQAFQEYRAQAIAIRDQATRAQFNVAFNAWNAFHMSAMAQVQQQIANDKAELHNKINAMQQEINELRRGRNLQQVNAQSFNLLAPSAEVRAGSGRNP